jgi:hypothetical protein
MGGSFEAKEGTNALGSKRRSRKVACIYSPYSFWRDSLVLLRLIPSNRSIDCFPIEVGVVYLIGLRLASIVGAEIDGPGDDFAWR